MHGENASVLATTCAGVCVVYASDNVPFASVIWRRYRFVAQLCEFKEEKKNNTPVLAALCFPFSFCTTQPALSCGRSSGV